MKKIIALVLFIGTQTLTVFAQTKQEVPAQVQLEGAINFRDIGGYATTNGKKVVPNKIYRSAAIEHLTDNDMKELEKRKIYTVIDFRGTEEAAKAPDRLLPNADYTLCPAGSENVSNGNFKDIIEKLKDEKGSFLDDFYGEASVQYAGDRFRKMFYKLLSLEDDQALLYHCTGGRDRTGMATALILYILDVPMETIERDYVASNVFLKEKRAALPDSKEMYASMVKATGLSLEQIEKKFELRPEWIRSFFAAINSKYGSVENFLKDEMNITSSDITKLRAKYTK